MAKISLQPWRRKKSFRSSIKLLRGFCDGDVFGFLNGICVSSLRENKMIGPEATKAIVAALKVNDTLQRLE